MLPMTPIVGRLTHDPELRFSARGNAVCSFSLACSERRKNKQTEQWEDVNPTFFRCTAFGELGENIAESLRKGDETFVLGKIYQEEYVGRDGVAKTSYQQVLVEACGPNLRFATAQAKRAQRGSQQAEQPQQQQPAQDPWASVPAREEEPPF